MSERRPCQLYLVCSKDYEEVLVKWLTERCPSFELRARTDVTSSVYWQTFVEHTSGCPLFVNFFCGDDTPIPDPPQSSSE